mgnify:CR=1 FL=1
MKKIKSLLLSLKEIFIVLFIQYFILIISIILFNGDKNIYIGNILLSIFSVIYIFSKKKVIDVSFNIKNNYFIYIMLGSSISIIYNMILYRLNLYTYNANNNILFLDILTSGIIGPIFEEVLFRVSFIPKVGSFIYNKKKVILVTSIIFAILHFNILSGFIAFIIGIINGYIYIKTRDVVRISLVHISLNTISSLITSYNIVIFILGIILMIVAVLCLRKEKRYL